MRFGYHGAGWQPWNGHPRPTFDIGDRARLIIDGNVDHVTVTGKHDRHRYSVRFPSGATLIVAVDLLDRITA